MKRIIILLILIVGCSRFSTVTENFPNWTQTQNQRHAYTYEENLKGLTKDEILDRFGTPDEKTTDSDIVEGQQEIWTYGSALGYNRKIKVIFTNNTVKSINYQ